ncbi:adenosine receptor A3-like [Oculina patagonica]
MENSTSLPSISTATPTLQEWCDTQSHQGQLPAFITCSSVFNAVVNSLLSLVTVSGNILILLSLKKTSRVHAASKALYCSLAVSDLGVGLFVQPAYVGSLVIGGAKPEICRLLGTIIHVAGVISVGISLQILSVISVDRVLAIRLKMRYKEVATIFRTRLVLVACWFFSTFHALMLFVSAAFFTLFQILGIIMCIDVSTVSYVVIFHTLRRLQRQVQNYGPGEEASQNTFNIKRCKKSVSTALWVYASLLASYLPFMFSVAVQMSVSRNLTFIAVQWYTVTLIYMNSALNPILYCWKIPEVSESVKEIIKGYCCCRK